MVDPWWSLAKSMSIPDMKSCLILDIYGINHASYFICRISLPENVRTVGPIPRRLDWSQEMLIQLDLHCQEVSPLVQDQIPKSPRFLRKKKQSGSWNLCQIHMNTDAALLEAVLIYLMGSMLHSIYDQAPSPILYSCR